MIFSLVCGINIMLLCTLYGFVVFFFFKQKTAYEMRISDWSSDVCSSDLCWIAGFSFGAWIGMQLLMRRPEITGFISISPPANMYDFSFLAPCPSSGMIVIGGRDQIVPPESVQKLVDKLRQQRGIEIDHRIIPDANHFFGEQIEELTGEVDDYLDTALKRDGKDRAAG